MHNHRDVQTLSQTATAENRSFSAPIDQAPVIAQQRHVNDLVLEHARNLDGILNGCNCGRRLSPPRLHLRICATRTPGTLTTLSEECNCGTTVFSTVGPKPCRLHTNGHVDDQLRTALWNPRLLHSLHCAYRLVVEKTTGKQQPCPRTAPVARTTGMSKLSPELTVWTITPGLYNNGTSATCRLKK